MILILYATYTGYTKKAAELLYKNLTAGFTQESFKLMNARDMDPDKLLNCQNV